MIYQIGMEHTGTTPEEIPIKKEKPQKKPKKLFFYLDLLRKRH